MVSGENVTAGYVFSHIVWMYFYPSLMIIALSYSTDPCDLRISISSVVPCPPVYCVSSTMLTMFCPQCGQFFSETHRFCMGCGHCLQQKETCWPPATVVGPDNHQPAYCTGTLSSGTEQFPMVIMQQRPPTAKPQERPVTTQPKQQPNITQQFSDATPQPPKCSHQAPAMLQPPPTQPSVMQPTPTSTTGDSNRASHKNTEKLWTRIKNAFNPQLKKLCLISFSVITFLGALECYDLCRQNTSGTCYYIETENGQCGNGIGISTDSSGKSSWCRRKTCQYAPYMVCWLVVAVSSFLLYRCGYNIVRILSVRIILDMIIMITMTFMESSRVAVSILFMALYVTFTNVIHVADLTGERRIKVYSVCFSIAGVIFSISYISGTATMWRL